MAQPDRADTTARADLMREASALYSTTIAGPQPEHSLAGAFLREVANLPSVQPRTVYLDSSRTHAWSVEDAAALPDSIRARLVRRTLDDHFYWYTRYGTPLAYARPISMLEQPRGGRGAPADGLRGRRILDFGYGGIGQLRLMAGLGADAVGVEVDPLLPALYGEPGDTGAIGSNGGSVTLVDGQWPADPAVRRQVGGGYDLVISKNVLKRGYIHPERAVNPRMLVHLGVDDSTFVRALADIVKPGGVC